MSNDRRPLTEHVTKGSHPDFSKLGWVAGVVGVALAILFLVLWYNALSRQHELESLGSKLDEANSQLNAALGESQKQKDQIADLQKQIADLQQEKADAAQMAKGLEQEMRTDLESKDVTISKLQGKLTVNITDRVLFNSGEAELQPAGETVMRKIAALLAAHPNIKIHVVGHTDNVPIRPEAHGRFASNWELSTARALAAVHFLTERAGVDPRRVGAVGYGENRPIADNATAEGRSKNRRIAIIILPDEVAVADAPPVAPVAKPAVSLPTVDNTPLPPLPPLPPDASAPPAN
ncbi:MAG TPA: OmpA family protein [Verrucomicrobiae bacterium]|nr:OmpA family protein [Verrucomicrobiae bacterium]